MPQSYSYWRRVDFVRSDTLIRSAIARWRLAGVEWLRAIFAIFAIFLAPVPAGRCRERPGSSPAVVPPRRPSFVLLFTSHGTSVQLLKSTPALRPVFLIPTRARIATHSCAHATAYPAIPEWSSRSFSSLSAARQGVSGPRVVQPFIFTRYPLPEARIRTASGPGVHLHSLSAAKKAYPDPEWSSRSSSLATRRQEGVSGSREVQPFIFSHYPLPGRRLRDPGWSSSPSHSLSAARKAYPDPEWSSPSSLLAIRRQEGVSGPRVVQAFIFTCYPPPGRRFRTATGPGVYRHSLSAARKAYPDRDWSRRLSSLVIRHQEGVSGSRVVQAFTLTRYPLPEARIRTASGPGVHLHSLSAAKKAYPDPEWSSRSSSLATRRQEGVSGSREVQPFIFSHYPLPGRRLRDPGWSSRPSLLAIRRQEGVSGPRVVQAFIFTCYPPPGRRFRTATGPGVYRHSLSAARKAYPDRDWSRRLSSLVIRHQEGVSGSRVVQAFTLTRYPLPEARIRTASGPGVHLHSLSAAKKAYPDPEWSSRSSSLATRRQEGVSGSREVQPFIFSHYPLPGRRLRDPGWSSRPSHSLSAARKAYPDPEWSSRSSLLAIRRQEGVSGPRVVQPFFFSRYPPPGRRLRIPGGPAVHLQSLSAARKASPGSRVVQPSISLAIRRQEGVSGPRVVQPFIFTRHPPPGRRIRTAGGSGVHLHLLSASRKAFPDRDWSRRLSSLAIRRQEGVSRPRLVQAFIFTRYPPPGGRIRIPSGPGVHPHSLSASRKAYRDPEWSRRSSSLAIRRQEGVSGPRVVQAFVRTRYPPPERRIGTPSGPAVHFHSLSATGEAFPDRDWSYRSSSLAIRRQEGAPRPRVVQPFIFTRHPLPGRRIRTATGPGDYLHSLSAARKAHPDPEWSTRSSSLAIRRQEGVS